MYRRVLLVLFLGVASPVLRGRSLWCDVWLSGIHQHKRTFVVIIIILFCCNSAMKEKWWSLRILKSESVGHVVQWVPATGPSWRTPIIAPNLYSFVFGPDAPSVKWNGGSERSSVQGLGLSRGADCSALVFRGELQEERWAWGGGVTLEEDQTQILSVWKPDLRGLGLTFSFSRKSLFILSHLSGLQR